MTTFVFSVLGKYVAIWISTKTMPESTRRRYESRYRPRTRCSRRVVHCNCLSTKRKATQTNNCESYVININPPENEEAKATSNKGSGRIEVRKKVDQNIALSVTFDRLGIPSDRPSNQFDLDHHLQFQGPDESVINGGNIQLSKLTTFMA